MSDPNAEKFREMADRIDLNKGQGFGGAFCIVPPGDGTPLTTLILDADSSPAAFWAIVKAKADIALAELDDKQRQQASPFGRR